MVPRVFRCRPNTGPPPHTNRPGEWLFSLGLAEPSAPTWVDARLSIVNRSPLPPKHPTSGKHRNVASLPIKTTSSQLSPGEPISEVVVSLDEILFESGESTYIVYKTHSPVSPHFSFPNIQTDVTGRFILYCPTNHRHNVKHAASRALLQPLMPQTL